MLCCVLRAVVAVDVPVCAGVTVGCVADLFRLITTTCRVRI